VQIFPSTVLKSKWHTDLSWNQLQRALKAVRGQSDDIGLPRTKSDLVALLRSEAPELEETEDSSERANDRNTEEFVEGLKGQKDEPKGVEAVQIREVLRLLAGRLHRTEEEMDTLADRFEANWFYTVRDVRENLDPEDSVIIGVPLLVTKAVLKMGKVFCFCFRSRFPLFRVLYNPPY
jgi:hypothetical protein